MMKKIRAFLAVLAITFGFVAMSHAPQASAATGYLTNCYITAYPTYAWSACYGNNGSTLYNGLQRIEFVCQKWGGQYWIYESKHGNYVLEDYSSIAWCSSGYNYTAGSAWVHRL